MLEYAIENENKEIVAFLLEMGVDPRIEGPNGSPRSIAKQKDGEKAQEIYQLVESTQYFDRTSFRKASSLFFSLSLQRLQQAWT